MKKILPIQLNIFREKRRSAHLQSHDSSKIMLNVCIKHTNRDMSTHSITRVTFRDIKSIDYKRSIMYVNKHRKTIH